MANGDIRKGHTGREDRWVLGNNSKITKLKVQNDQARKRSKEICSDKGRAGAALGGSLLEFNFWENISLLETHSAQPQEHRESFLGNNVLQCLPRLDL